MPHVINGLVSNAVNAAIANVTINGYTAGGEQFNPSDFNFTTATVNKFVFLQTDGDGDPQQYCIDAGGGKIKIMAIATPNVEQVTASALAFRMTLTFFVMGA